MPTPPPEQLVEVKPDDGYKATTTEPSLDPPEEQLKSVTPKMTDKDASGITPAAEYAAGKDTKEKSDSILQTTETLAESGAVGGSDETQNLAADSKAAKEDPPPTNKAESGNDNKTLTKEDFSDDDSLDEIVIDTAIQEEDEMATTAEGQELYMKRAPKRIKQFGQYFWNVEYRIRFLERELKKLRVDDIKSQPDNDSKKTAVASQEIVLSIRRLTWAAFKQPRSSQGASGFVIPEVSGRFTWEGYEMRPNLQKQGEPDFAKASGDQNNATLGATSKRQHHVLEVLIEDPGTGKRRRVKKRVNDESVPSNSGRNAKIYQKDDAIAAQTSKSTLQCPERVRFCSGNTTPYSQYIRYKRLDKGTLGHPQTIQDICALRERASRCSE